MAITDYTELQAAIANWLNRSDLTLRAPEFIALAEARIRRVARTEVVVSPLSSVNTSNTILSEAPDVYLYGALLEAMPFLEHDERLPNFKALFDNAIAEYNEYKRSRGVGVAITSYSTLLAAVDSWLNRLDLTSRVPELIDLADKQIKRRLRRNVVRVTNFTIDAIEETVPATVSEVRSIKLTTGQAYQEGPLESASRETLYERRTLFTTAGRPTMFAVIDGVILFDRTPDQSYTAELVGFEAHTALTSGAPVNAVITEAPDLYLYGALKEAAPYLKEDERVPMWETKFETTLKQLNDLREKEEHTASLKPARLPAVF